MDTISSQKETEEDLCLRSICIPYKYNHDNIKIECPNYKEQKCYTIDRDLLSFYQSINWNMLRLESDTFMDNFKNYLNTMYEQNTNNFQSLVKSVYPNIVARMQNTRPGIETPLLFTKTDDISTNNFECNDINYSFSIECQTDNGIVKSEIVPPYSHIRFFHIALHSELPKCYKINKNISEMRSNWTCGLFEKKTSDEDPCNRLHYKIDNYHLKSPLTSNQKKHAWGSQHCERKKLNEDECPCKQFISDSSQPGAFQVINDNHFENVNFPDAFGDQKRKYDFISLHQFIYNEFVQFWNSLILPFIKITPLSEQIGSSRVMTASYCGKSRKSKKNSRKNKIRKIKSKRYYQIK
jgi:hypothetical protein